jgi:hypothetical protein
LIDNALQLLDIVSDASTNETVFVGQEKYWEKKKLELEDAKNYKGMSRR